MYEIYEELLKTKNISSYQVSKATGISQQTLSNWKLGRSTPKYDKLLKIAEYLGVNIDFLTTGQIPKQENTNKKRKAAKVPVVGAVPAGIPIEAIEDIIDYEEIDEETAKKGEYFGLKIQGNSMYPLIMENDVVIVRKQETIESGQVAIVMVNGDEATCKKVIIKDGGIMLVGHNPEFTPLYFSAKEIETKPVRIIGRVIEIRRTL